MTITSVTLWYGVPLNAQELWKLFGQEEIAVSEYDISDFDYDILEALTNGRPNPLRDIASNYEQLQATIAQFASTGMSARIIPHDQAEKNLENTVGGSMIMIGYPIDGPMGLVELSKLSIGFGLDEKAVVYALQNDCHCCS